MNKKLAIIISHPIQYYSPLFQRLAKQCDLKVFYTLGNSDQHFDIGFQRDVKWDIPLLSGYNYSFIDNRAKNPSPNRFTGIVNPNLIDEIQSFAPHAILFYGWAYYSHLKAMMYFKKKIPIWFRGDSNLNDKQSMLKKTARKILLNWVYSKVNKAFYVGIANKDYFKHFGLKEKELFFCPHAVDNDRFGKDRNSEALTLRTKLEIETHDVLILFAGKLEEKKDPALLLNAFLELNISTMHLLFVGNGHLEDFLKKTAQNDQNFKRIHFLDFQNQSFMPVVYQACDLFCLPSKGPNETWGLSVNEAMAAKKAVLVSNKVGCWQDLVKENYNGFIFKSEKIDDLKEKLLLLNDIEKLKKLGQNSSEIIASWSFEKQSQKFIQQLYASI